MKSGTGKLHDKYFHMDLERHLEGTVTLSVQEDRTAEVLGILSAAKIPLYQVTPKKSRLYFNIALDDFKAVQHLLRNNHIRFHICGKWGLPFFISRFKRRKGVWAGLLGCVLLGNFLLSFLWGYEVTGNERYSDAHIVALVQQYGLWQGTPLNSLDYEALEHEIELDHPEFTWIQLETKGTTLCISVKERLADDADIQTSGSIVAKADGQITELLVYTGTALVNTGDWVSAGQVLVGGWDYPNRVRNTMGEFVDAGEPYAVQAKSVVRGYTEHRAISTCALDETWLTKTGNKTTGRKILWNEHHLISIGEKESPYPYSDTERTIKSLFQWGTWQCPIKICTTIYEEQVAVHRKFTEEEAYQTALERARRQLQLELPRDGKFIRESSGLRRSVEDGVVQVEVIWVTDEPIGQNKQVPLPDEIVIETNH